MAEGSGSFNFNSHFNTATTSSSVLIGCEGDKNHDLYSQESSTGTTVCYTTDTVTVSDNDICLIVPVTASPSDTEVTVTTDSSNLTAAVPISSALRGDSTRSMKYMVKVISHHCDGVKVINWENQCCKFTDVSNLRSGLLADCKNFIHEDPFEFGYIQPGHGSKGRQLLLHNNTALDEMYATHKKNLFILWLKVTKHRATKRSATNDHQKGTKKPCTDATNTPASHYQGHLKNMSEVQTIVDELEKKHASSYTPEQLRVWGHMIQLQKHDSFEVPPSKPFFKTNKASATSGVTLSPGKRIMYRTECINQLDKWHSLLEKRVISKAQFEELQGPILSDIKKF